MNELIDVLKNGPVLNKAFFVMVTGMLGVFIVLVVFYISIAVLNRVYRSKAGKESAGNP
jgi:Na+-transporting methylmalonyl-CoA/oxaloacetate decarboxylase gamma subunit